MTAFCHGTPAAVSSALRAIARIDYTVIFARDMAAMRAFYGGTLGFAQTKALSETWIEYTLGPNVLALTQRGVLFDDPPPPAQALSLQLAFRVGYHEVDACAQALRAQGVAIEREPTDQPWGHRTLFFRDPDGNVLEIYAEIGAAGRGPA